MSTTDNALGHEHPPLVDADADETVGELEEDSYVGRQIAALRDLVSLSSEGERTEHRIAERRQAELEAVDERTRRTRRRLEKRHGKLRAAVDEGHQRELAEVDERHAAQLKAADEQRDEALEKLAEKHAQAADQLKSHHEHDRWAVDAMHESAVNRIRKRDKDAAEQLKQRREHLSEHLEQARAALVRYRMPLPGHFGQITDEQHIAAEAGEADVAGEAYEACQERVERALRRLGSLSVPALFVGLRPWLMSVVLILAPLVVTFFLMEEELIGTPTMVLIYAAVIAGSALVLAMAGWLLNRLARKQAWAAYEPVHEALHELRRSMVVEYQKVIEQGKAERKEADERRRTDRKAVDEKYKPRMEQLKAKEAASREAIEKRHRERRGKADDEHKAERERIEQRYQQDVEAIESRYARYRERLDARHERRKAAIEQEAEAELAKFQKRWRRGIDRLKALVDETEALAVEHTRALDDPAWRQWQPSDEGKEMTRFGALSVDVRQLASTAARQGRYRVEMPKAFETPVALKLPQRGSLLIEHDHAGREQALATLQATMARLLVTLPPARARFTIVDPVGLGQNFAGFMHLADFDEKLVTNRIWTENEQIERRLADLSEHMENVIQKYLRNEFETIDQYNAQAGELAEPYRFLVLADAPAGISEDAAKRLRSIINSGARCGVYVLMAMDTSRPMPTSLVIEELEKRCLTLKQVIDPDRAPEAEPRFTCVHPVYGHFPVTLDDPPDEDVLTTLVQKAGKAAQEAGVVEVPFEHIAPKEDQLWSADCTDELRVPVGRSGAVRKQEVRFGKGVAQHALIAGKTGSGKSTLLHVLVTNLALWYSPDQVQFYLVDFKKGVEFKTYARHDLPHAQVVAIESDREFGLSVLKRLDEELERRGEMFRKQGVQTIAEYRRARPEEVLPRNLLIVDEFQELFTEDDKVAQDAALLIDRLVRQGRAFGIHVILGSQTLGGSTGLSRGTMGQMAVRVALQCNEADSQLIFDDSNTAARLLSRPGEAIYNDAGGMVEGNNPFQVSWLSDSERERALTQVTELARQHGRADEPTIVFEGAESADPRENRQLVQLLQRKDWPDEAEVEAVAWMGQPVTIAPPTGVRLRRHHAANVLVVGQRDDAALAMLQTAMLSLAAQRRPGRAKFVVFDATPADEELAVITRELVEGLPHDAYLVPWRETEAAMAELAAELERRKAADEAQHGGEAGGGDEEPELYAFILGLQRYRVLRKQEDTLGFSFGAAEDDEAPAGGQADKQLAELLSEGPPVGIHVLTWCDTLLSLERTFDRQTLREFDARVLLQMSGTDSSHLIDSPAASQLGFHRALLASDEAGTMEKFRPYKAPDAKWLAEVVGKLKGRGG